MQTLIPDAPVHFLVDGVGFDLDISALDQTARAYYHKMTAKGQIYEPVMTRCLARLLQDMNEPRFMDVGGFVGYYTCYVAKLLAHLAPPIYTIESNPAFCRQIRQSCEMNGIRNANVFEALLSNRAEAATVDGSGIVFGDGAGKSATLTTTLDHLCERHGLTPNILKMDIHGSEGKALGGMTALARQLEYLLVEIHPHDRLEVYSPGVTRADIMELLWDADFSVYFVAGHRLHGDRKNRDCVSGGRFAYRRVTTSNVEDLFFDRSTDVFLLCTRTDDIEAVIGPSLNDPFLCF
jgi:FkbM family methyltransferase